jgi:hypothetical protein
MRFAPSPHSFCTHIVANPLGQLVTYPGRPVPSVQEENGRIAIYMSDCASDRLVDGPHAGSIVSEEEVRNSPRTVDEDWVIDVTILR